MCGRVRFPTSRPRDAPVWRLCCRPQDVGDIKAVRCPYRKAVGTERSCLRLGGGEGGAV